MRRRLLWIALFCCALASPAVLASPCFEQGDKSTGSTCNTYIESIVADQPAIRSLGRRLEIADRYEQAADVYRRALSRHRNDKALQKGLIRVRSELRDRAILGGFERRPDDSVRSPCWTLSWDAALAACREEVAVQSEDWSLRERYGDVLRSVGQPRAALGAYRESLALNANNARLRKKFDVLIELVDLEKAALTTSELSQLTTPAAAIAEAPSPVTAPAIAAAVPPPPPVQIQGGRYRAIVFGNQDYDQFEDLASPVADASEIGKVLREQYGFEVSVVLNATRYEVFDVLAELRRRSSEYDSVLIYYAGHGYLDATTKRGYWLPVDAEFDNAANWISTSDITNLVAGLESTHALVIADSCFSGALTRTVSVDSFESRQALLQRLSSRRSRMILTSGGLEPVLDGGDPFSRHSVFADALLDALNGNTSVVEAGRLFVDVRDAVALASDQTPQYAPLRSAGHDGGDFIFVRQSLPARD